MKLTASVGKWTLQFRSFHTPALPIQGYTSRCEDGQHVLFLDYDNVSPEIVKADLRALAPRITHALIFATDVQEDDLGPVGNFHVICLDRFSYHECYQLMRETHCDNLHRDLAKRSRYRAWVLRFTMKGRRPAPELIEFLSFGTQRTRLQSNAHHKLLKVLFPDLPKVTKGYDWILDDTEECRITHYNTVVERKAT